MEIERVYNDLWGKLFVDIYQLIQVQIFYEKLVLDIDFSNSHFAVFWGFGEVQDS